MRKTIIVSAVNLNLGGTLTIAKELLANLDAYKEFRVLAFVHDKKNYPAFEHVKLIQLPDIKRSWLKRIFFEYYSSGKIAKRIKSDYWICVHDMSARVNTGEQFVYCHNPSPFYDSRKLSDIVYDWRFYLFTMFYGFLYGINIKKNKAVFVQQEWIAKEFKKRYQVDNVVVVRPETVDSAKNYFSDALNKKQFITKERIKVFYPAIPRIFKNYEVILEAAKILHEKGNNKFEFILTFSGNENKYAKKLFKKYSYLTQITFTGLLTTEQMIQLYSASDILCFPSKLETWGLPISEAKSYRLPLLLANMDYAHETAGDYDKVCFFDNKNPEALANIFLKIAEGEEVFKASQYDYNALSGWKEFIDFVVKG